MKHVNFRLEENPFISFMVIIGTSDTLIGYQQFYYRSQTQTERENKHIWFKETSDAILIVVKMYVNLNSKMLPLPNFHGIL